MISQYRALLAIPGARLFMLGGIICRLGGASFGVAVVAMVSARQGSYGLAGAVSAVGLVILAITAAIVGRLVDKFGQRRVTLPLVVWSAAWGLVMALASAADWPRWTLFVAYGLSAVVATTGTMSRARWSMLLADDPAKLHTAMSLEQFVDELSFVGGPALAVILATTWFPEAGFLAAVLLYAVGALIFISARSTEPPVHEGSHTDLALAARRPEIILLTCVMFMTGAIFGSNEVVTIAVSEALGNKSASGLILAVFALGSGAAALLYGTRELSISLAKALLIGTAGMCLLEAPVLIVNSIPALTVVMFVAGVATAPTLITSLKIAQYLVPPTQLNEAMGLVFTGMIVGIAAGSAGGGLVIQHFGAHAGYAVPVTAGALSFVLALAGYRLIRRA